MGNLPNRICGVARECGVPWTCILMWKLRLESRYVDDVQSRVFHEFDRLFTLLATMPQSQTWFAAAVRASEIPVFGWMYEMLNFADRRGPSVTEQAAKLPYRQRPSFHLHMYKKAAAMDELVSAVREWKAAKKPPQLATTAEAGVLDVSAVQVKLRDTFHDMFAFLPTMESVSALCRAGSRELDIFGWWIDLNEFANTNLKAALYYNMVCSL